MTKKCSLCHSDKDLHKDFYADNSCKGGKSTVCKECHSKYKNKSIKERDFINNPELIIELCTQ